MVQQQFYERNFMKELLQKNEQSLSKILNDVPILVRELTEPIQAASSMSLLDYIQPYINTFSKLNIRTLPHINKIKCILSI